MLANKYICMVVSKCKQIHLCGCLVYMSTSFKKLTVLCLPLCPCNMFFRIAVLDTQRRLHIEHPWLYECNHCSNDGLILSLAFCIPASFGFLSIYIFNMLLASR